MKLQVMSDLHLRPQHGFTIPETDADLIVLAGDIGRGLSGVQWAMDEAGRLGKPIVYVFGNHEYYTHVFPDLADDAKRAAAGSGVHVLENDQLIWGQTRILGCTLWTDFLLFGEEQEQDCIAVTEAVLYDYKIIRTADQEPLRAHLTQQRHRESREWLETRLAEPWAGPTVVVTHHAPCREGSHPHFDGPLTAAFTSDLKPLMERHSIDLWICGHSHANVDLLLGRTRLLSNQQGYPAEQVPGPAFEPGKVVAVG
ncbi:MAG TPA: metallophosphoesterase [Gammaproteobacteria bacterium]|nr:metallophosphoesterase [Gammaproteobacteria bacterium]